MSYNSSIFDKIKTDADRLKLLDIVNKESKIILPKSICELNQKNFDERMAAYAENKKIKYEINEGATIKKLKPIKYSLKFSNKEIIIQAELYHYCKIKEIECHLEVSIYYDTAKKGSIDAVLKINNEPIGFECKNKQIYEIKNYKIQFYKYLKIGIPIILLTKVEQIKPIIKHLSNMKLENKIYCYNEMINNLSAIDVNSL